MRRDEISNKIEGESPPDCPKYITSDLLHPSHHIDTVIYLGEELEQKHQQKYRHYELDFFFSYQIRYHQPKDRLNEIYRTTKWSKYYEKIFFFFFIYIRYSFKHKHYILI